MWYQLDPTNAHVAYVLVGTISLVFSLLSFVLRQQFYIGEAIFGTIFGCIIGPHALDWFNPSKWTSNVDELTFELSRLILVIQLFATGAELPPRYMLDHARSLNLVLFGAMVYGWLILSLIVWAVFHSIGLKFSDSLLVGATFVATDPVLAAAIVGKSKFAQRIRADVRNLIQAESGANDGLAFPFVTLSINLIINRPDNVHAGTIIKDWILLGILYQCALGVVLGVTLGWVGRKSYVMARANQWMDNESSLVFYVALSLIITGLASVLGCDDLLASFAAGCTFSWKGQLDFDLQPTTDEDADFESLKFSSIMDLLLNTAYFVYFGSIIPWPQFTPYAWKLVVLGIAFLLLARIPALLMLQYLAPDIRNWKDALFIGHFGPRGVGSIFCCLLAKHLLETRSHNVEEHETLLNVLWPVTTFIVVISVLVHGFSICCFTVYNKTIKVHITRQPTPITLETQTIPEEGTSIARRRMSKLRVTQPAVDDPSFPKHAYVSRSKVTLMNHKGDVLNEFEVKDSSVDCSSKLVAFREGNQIVIEDGGREMKRYDLEDLS
ncbi:hypothetical protein OGAPHI_000257 [Ogataea philodendri]|uniref:Cation/H+ exchanger transmembrane domain-containing protein n=1 Tax=Ogataea philodendri TaxID=1378263 RepID=A0A9P8TAF3_9ASCO|nr:uncharacterized protein OGAPHI_000257 [Ogataea philodendri]KAH3671554.1 hypothetical protein OGAPHI_000257 [Ogataea philodendri]